MLTSRRLTIVLISLTVLFAGCKSSTESGGDSNATSAAANSDTETTLVATTILCGKCGEEKGGALCCVESVETCECGMHKGTPLCCAHLAADAVGKDICSACGHVADAGHVCDTDCPKCPDCGLHQASVACCKLNSEG